MKMSAFLCSICFQPIDVNACKIDERGRAVHENCYATLALYRPKKPASVGLLSRVFAKIRPTLSRESGKRIGRP